MVIDPGGKKWSHALTLSLSENGNKRRQIASVETLLIFNVSHTSRKIERCKLGSSMGVSPNSDCCTMDMSAGLSTKLLAVTGGPLMPKSPLHIFSAPIVDVDVSASNSS